MPTIQDLFKSQKKDLYGLSGGAIIESRGLINPPRGAALLASSPTALSDLIGNQIGGIVKGSANRPSDTIFKNNTALSKPISLFKRQSDLRNAVDKGTDYFVKQSPSPNSILATLNQGASNLTGVAANLAINAVTKGGVTKLGLRNLATALKNPKQGGFTTLSDTGGTQLPNYSNKNKFSDSLPRRKQFDTDLVQTHNQVEESELREFIREHTGKNHVLVLFQKYGNSTSIPFEGTITGLNEDIQPEWSNFKYLGSPFKVNRYGGVERSLKFNLKLYYLTPGQKLNMIKKINFLKSLTFPYEEISEITYGGNTQTSQYAFSPNLLYLTIGDMYKNVFGYMESLSFSVEENTVWPSPLPDNDSRDTFMYPSVIDVSINIKIIENHKTETQNDITRYKYDFDGRGTNFTIEETQNETNRRNLPPISTPAQLPIPSIRNTFV